MRFVFAHGAILFLLTATLIARDREIGQHPEWMKAIGTSMAALRRSFDTSESQAAVTEAKKLEETFQKVREFWGKRDAADAVRFARQAEASAAAIAKKASAGQLDSAKPDLDELTASCGSCHNVHRYELPGGGYRVF
jgi:hypothetical protein